MIRRIAALLVAVAAVAGVNALLLVYGSNHNDPVGRLSPIANVQLRSPHPAPAATVTGKSRVEDD